METPHLSGSTLAVQAARLADEKKAENIEVLDLRGISPIADFFVICAANSLPHLSALRREVGDRMKAEHATPPHGNDGGGESGWAVIDYVDVLVHILLTEKRDFYSLETLWSDAPRVEWQGEETGDAPAE